MSDKLRRSLNVETRVLSEAEGLVEYVASDATLDCYREVIDPRGWQFTHFAKNAPFVDSHDYWSIEKQLGKVVSFEVVGGKLLNTVKWAKEIAENKLAVLGWKMTLGGFLKAVSVGFMPVKAYWAGSNEFAEAAKALNLDVETTGKCRRIFTAQEQIELSACILGANPNALAKAWEAGAVKDADLAGVGFDDDDLHFLRAAGRALEKPETDEVTRTLIAREMGRIAGRSKISGRPGDGTGDSAGRRAAAELAERRAAERREFLKRLGA